MAIGRRGRMGTMGTGFRECTCSILNAREEKLLDDEGRVQVRLICNRCGTVLDSETVSAGVRRVASIAPLVARRKAEAEAAEGS